MTIVLNKKGDEVWRINNTIGIFEQIYYSKIGGKVFSPPQLPSPSSITKLSFSVSSI